MMLSRTSCKQKNLRQQRLQLGNQLGQFVHDCIPDNRCVDAKIAVHQAMPHADDALPGEMVSVRVGLGINDLGLCQRLLTKIRTQLRRGMQIDSSPAKECRQGI